MHVYNHPFPSFPENQLLLTYPRNCWLRHTQGHSLSIISYELNTCNVIIRCRPYPPWNCIDEWRNNWLCLVLRAACLRFDIRGIASSDTRPHHTKEKRHCYACHQRPRHCHGGYQPHSTHPYKHHPWEWFNVWHRPHRIGKSDSRMPSLSIYPH